MPMPLRLARSVETMDGQSLPLVMATGTPVNATVVTASTAEAALPAGSRVIEVRATVAVAIRFGNTGMGAAALDATSILFPAGEKVMLVPESAVGVPYDFFRVLRAAGVDGTLQIQKVDTQ